MTQRFLAIVNPAAGGGRCGQRAPAAVARLREAGLDVEMRTTSGPEDATRLASEGFDEGFRYFIAGGGDGTDFEVINGFLPKAQATAEPVRFGFLPLGTGNAFLQDYTKDGPSYAERCLIDDQRRQIDVAVLHHQDGRLFFINLIGFGFPADVTIRAAGGLKRFGALGYILGVLFSLAGLRHPCLPLQLGSGERFDEPVVQFTISNSRYTANGMLIAPDAKLDDGQVDLVTVAPMGRFQVLRAFPTLFSGKHVQLPTISARAAAEITFETDRAVDLMIDGEIRRVVPQRIEVLQKVLEIYA